MSRLQQATQRLDHAVSRLENAIAAQPPLRDDPATRAERDRLGEELAEARAENDRLRETNDAIAGRLDTAIHRLKSVLEG